MKIFTVSLFGHRQIEDLRSLEKQLKSSVRNIVEDKEYVSFLIGRNGEFDEFAASVIKGMSADSHQKSYDLTLVLPYAVADIEYYEKYYDYVEIPDFLQKAHPKAAISLKNRWMVEHSDLIIVWVNKNDGGAFAALKYAERLGKQTINLCNKIED